MSYDDTLAVVAVIDTIPILTGRTFISEAEDPAHIPVAAPYAVVHPGAGRDRQIRLAAGKVERPRFTVHLVGEDGAQAAVLLDLAKAKFIVAGLGVTMTVTGRRNERVWFETPIPVQVDKSSGKSVPFAVAELGWQSEPA